jgi:hypothetical protein
MNYFAFEPLHDRYAPAGLNGVAALGNVMPSKSPVLAEVTLLTRITAQQNNVHPGFNHLVSEPPPPQRGIEGTDVGGDTYYSYHK